MQQVATLESPALPKPPRILGAVGMVLLYLLLQFVFGTAAGVALLIEHLLTAPVADFATARHGLATPEARTRLMLFALPMAALTCTLIVRRIHAARWRSAAADAPGLVRTSSATLAGSLLLGLATAFVGGILTRLLAGDHAVHETLPDLMRQTALPLRAALALVVVSVGPAVEELLFRGLLLPALAARMPVVIAVLVDAALFACMHLPDTGGQWYLMPVLGLLGVVACVLRLRTGSLYPAIAAHAGCNLLAALAMVAAG